MAVNATNVDGSSSLPLDRVGAPRTGGGWRSGLLVAAMLYVFISAITLMGHGLKTAASDDQAGARITGAFEFADSPLVGLCVGILVTSIVQSSSFTTSLTVTLVAARALTISNAVPVIMGANIGTSVTNLLVCVGHIRRRYEFRRALAGAAVHDFFNVLSVCLLFPLEVAFGILSRPAGAVGNWLAASGASVPDPTSFNLVKIATWPFVKGADGLFQDMLGLSMAWAGMLTAALAIVLLFASLVMLVKALRGLLMNRLSGLFGRVLFAKPWRSYTVGALTTALVQSSSVTTSLAVPLVGTGVLSLRQVYPYTLGANLGTTVTATLGALALAAGGESMGLAAAFAHMLFNLAGTAVFWPLKDIPIAMATRYAKVISQRRVWMVVFVIGFFFVLPLTVIVIAALAR